MPSEVNVAITSSTTEGTTSSHKTPTQTVVYGTSGEIKTSNTHFDYASNATPTQTAGISSFTLISSSMPTRESVTRTSSIFMPSEVNVAITSSTTEGTTSSHKTPTQTVVYGTSGEIKTSNTHFDYASNATPTQTVVHSSSEGSTQMLSNSGKVFSRPTTTPLYYSISTSLKANPTPKYPPISNEETFSNS